MALWNNRQDSTRSPVDPLPAPPPAAIPGPAPAEVAAPAEQPPAAGARGDAAARPGAGSGDLLLGAGVEFDGKLTFKGTVRIDAKFKGSIVTDDVLIVGERARIEADITCGTIVVDGEVNGNIRATTAVELHRAARVRGDVETPSLVVEQGVFIQGTVKMDRHEPRGPMGSLVS